MKGPAEGGVMMIRNPDGLTAGVTQKTTKQINKSTKHSNYIDDKRPIEPQGRISTFEMSFLFYTPWGVKQSDGCSGKKGTSTGEKGRLSPSGGDNRR